MIIHKIQGRIEVPIRLHTHDYVPQDKGSVSTEVEYVLPYNHGFGENSHFSFSQYQFSPNRGRTQNKKRIASQDLSHISDDKLDALKRYLSIGEPIGTIDFVLGLDDSPVTEHVTAEQSTHSGYIQHITFTFPARYIQIHGQWGGWIECYPEPEKLMGMCQGVALGMLPSDLYVQLDTSDKIFKVSEEGKVGSATLNFEMDPMAYAKHTQE